MNEPDHEKEFEAYLARRSGMHAGLSDGDGLEPPEELDRIVLSRARQAIRLPRQTRFYTSSRWALPMGLAATVVLTFAVMLHFGLLPKQVKEEVAALEANVIDQASTPIGPETAATAAAPAPSEVNIDAPMPTQSIGESERTEPTSRRRELLERLKAEQAIASRAENRAVPVASPAPAQSAPATQAASSAAAAAPTASDEQDAGSVAGQREDLAKRAYATEVEDPAEWLKRIELLRAQGKTEEADREWLAFRKTWPDYPVPHDAKP